MRYFIILILVSVNFLFADTKLYSENFPPFQIKQGSKISGISIDIVQEIQSIIGSKSKINIVIKKECLDEKIIGFDFIICDNECE